MRAFQLSGGARGGRGLVQLAVCAIGVVLVAPAMAGGQLAAREASAGNAEFFVGPLRPDGGAGCQMADESGQAFVTCQSHLSTKSGVLNQTATLRPDGTVQLCRGQGPASSDPCDIGNAGEGTPTLGVGQQKTVGRFRCKVSGTGVTCTIRSNGKGFFLSLDKVKRVGGAGTYRAPLQLAVFMSPDRKVWCSIDASAARCVAGWPMNGKEPPQHTAQVTRTGKVTLCSVPAPTFGHECVQNYFNNVTILRSGQKTDPIGYGFVCSSASNAITCTLDAGTKKGTGFRVSRHEAVRVHHS